MPILISSMNEAISKWVETASLADLKAVAELINRKIEAKRRAEFSVLRSRDIQEDGHTCQNGGPCRLCRW